MGKQLPACKIVPGRAKDFEHEGFSGLVCVPSSVEAGFNALLIDVHGRHPRKRMVDTTRVYLVLEGTGSFVLDGQDHEVAKDDLFVIPPGSEYEYAGNMRLFEFNVSPDNSFQDETLE